MDLTQQNRSPYTVKMSEFWYKIVWPKKWVRYGFKIEMKRTKSYKYRLNFKMLQLLQFWNAFIYIGFFFSWKDRKIPLILQKINGKRTKNKQKNTSIYFLNVTFFLTKKCNIYKGNRNCNKRNKMKVGIDNKGFLMLQFIF